MATSKNNAAKKKAIPQKLPPQDIIELDGEVLNFVSYATYFNRIPLFTTLRIFNNGEKDLENLLVAVSGEGALIMPANITLPLLPAQSSTELKVPPLLNPKFLAELKEEKVCKVSVNVLSGKKSVCSFSADVAALPMDVWSGLSGNVEMLSSHVRPKLSDCQKVLAEAGLQLKTWGFSQEWSGYSGNNKNAVRGAFAAIFAAVRHLNIERAEDPAPSPAQMDNVPRPEAEPVPVEQAELPARPKAVRVGNVSEIVEDRLATPLGMACFAASCLEAAKLNPVIVIGKEKLGVGVWLYESCFTATLQDDMSVVERYVADGVNNLAVVDVDDLFAHKNASYTTSSAHFSSALAAKKFDVCLDIKRCRIGGVFPMPIKVKNGSSYEILEDKQFSYEARPKDIIDADKLELGRAASKDKTWERRLLDLSLKNNLLAFRYRRDAIHLLTYSASGFLEKLGEREKLVINGNVNPVQGALYFGGGEKVKPLAELVDIELAQGVVRSYSRADMLLENASTLIRRARATQEEVGANTLYMAIGFLKWNSTDDKEFKYAPLVMLPVTLKKTKTQGIEVELSDEFRVNTTLLEFLKVEFGIDVRGIEGANLSPVEILAVMRAKTANMKGWLVHEDIYISQFTFARYAMWSDVRTNMPVYRQNPLIDSLLSNRNKLGENKLIGDDEDDGDPREVFIPLACDSSQYAAISESAKGTTFVLHGPPGTGKSQTITNIIANAVGHGKRVLFVAEKQAALQVVKKRLDEIGIGEFCLELHSGKSVQKSEIVRSIEATLELKDEFAEGEKYDSDAQKIVEDRSRLKLPLAALHKKRRIGVSVYEGILYYLQNKNAPELVNIESTFYDRLTAKKLLEYENMLLTAQAAAKECGGVYRSPFSGIEITDCDEKVQATVLCAAEVVLAELKHLKNYLGLFLETFNQKISAFTSKKLKNLVEICTVLKEDRLKTFFSCDESDFYVFYNANIRYDAEVRNWMTRFKSLPELGKLADDIEGEIENWGENYRSSRTLIAVLKRISRCGARTPLAESEELEWIKRAYEIEQARKKILSYTNLSSAFLGLGGVINDKKRDEFMRPVYALHASCASVFMDYNGDAFNSVCARAADGYLKPLLTGVITAAVAFVKACDHFAAVAKCDKNLVGDDDIFDYYTSKCTSLIDNIDMLPAWCMYKATAKKLNDSGLTFITDAMESGQISGEKILSAFRKNVYRNFIQTNIPADEKLSSFSAALMDETARDFAQTLEEFARVTRAKLRHDLIARLPSPQTEGPLALELMAFNRRIKGNVRGYDLRTIFTEFPELLKTVAPCLLMSPSTVSQYLPADPKLFDIVIFDEASQMPTCEAVPSLARAKSAVIVGDPKQMPPTSFFMNMEVDDDNLESEDLESVLDDCLALGIPEKHLNWHYRSKHESLIAFSNIMYYSSRLCTFPSPDADSHVKFRYVEGGVYERGGAKINKQEAEALVNAVIARLKDPAARRSSIGVVTFSTPQQVYIEKMLSKRVTELGLESAAYEREEPLFVKNLENVQGDERDVILFSVCYGPDCAGRISLNFGPLNQLGGWRRLNVAVSRAREEMIIFSSMRYSMIDLSRTTSRGVAGLKAFLEFAEKGRTTIARPSDEIIVNKNGIGRYVAAELSQYGYECRCDVGVSDFKIDVAVVDPKNRHNFILAILCDGTTEFSVKDRSVMMVQTLKRNNWNVVKLYAINFFNNPKREIKKIKEYLDKLTSTDKATANTFKKPYRFAKVEETQLDAQAILGGEHDGEIIKVIRAVVAAEEPISAQFLAKRVLSAFGIQKYGTKLESKINALASACAFKTAQMAGNTYYYKTDKAASFDRYRVESGTQVRTSDSDFTPYDVISLVRAVLLDKVSMYADELVTSVIKQLGVPRTSDKMTAFVNACIDEGVARGMFIRSISDRISLS